MKIGITERGDIAFLPYSLIGVDGAILITKDPRVIKNVPKNVIVHCTITGYGGTIVEPRVILPEVAIGEYNRIISEIGPDRCVLRIDPIIPCDEGIEVALGIFKYAKGRVRISFLDAYFHIRDRFARANLSTMITWEGLHAPLDIRQKYLKLFPGAEVCGEPGLECTGCISALDLVAIPY